MQKPEVQTISESDLAEITALHQRRLGWSYLLDETVSDRAVGFPCENEEFAIRRQLKIATQKVSEWFMRMGRENGWPSVPGWIWEVNFEAGKAVPKLQNPQQAGSQAGSDTNTSPGMLTEGPIMDLGDMEVDIIKHLLEIRNTHADMVRSNLRRSLEGNGKIEELYEIVQQLGASDKDVRDWFSEMADKHKWPKTEDNRWMYRVDTDEQKVYLSRRGV